MELLKACIEELRRKNIQHRRFVPDLSLYDAMTLEVIRDALRIPEISSHKRVEIASRISQRGRKIFAILVVLDQAADVLRFIEADELEDTRLPFKIETLSNEVGISNSKRFDETQWEFVAPIFVRRTLNRRLKDEVTLPFTKKTKVGKGAFGTVYRSQLEPGHQALDDTFPREFVMKEMQEMQYHRKELENLSVLNHLRHPNIIELLASYTLENSHTLLFSWAEHGNFAELLEKPRWDTEFHSNDVFFVALARLGSAIECIHDFFEHSHDPSLIGCHHDVRPHNILVSGNKLILADFGLSKFKDSLIDSNTPLRIKVGDYGAPECEESESHSETQRIGRSNDIWSFGCILAETVTYIVLGYTGVQNFKSERVFWTGPMKTHWFHNGRDTPSKAMLALNPLKRPKAKEVVSNLRLLTLYENVDQCDKFFHSVKESDDSLDILIEHIRVTAWVQAIGLDQPDINGKLESSLVFKDDSHFESLHSCLQQIHEDLEQRLRQKRGTQLSCSSLRQSNDQLIHLAGPEQQERIRTMFKISMHHTNDGRLTWNGSEHQSQSLDRDIRLSTALKHMVTLVENARVSERSRLLINTKELTLDVEKVGDHNTGRMRNTEGSQQVVVEWRAYGRDTADETNNRELFARLNAIVEQLSVPKPESMRALHCRGYFNDEVRHEFGIVYDMPGDLSRTVPPSTQVTTLQQWIASTKGKSKDWPVLDDKFKLAYDLAKAVLEFHLVGWLHKNLNTSNVAFFSAKEASSPEKYKDLRVVGFNHSRPDDPSAFTEGIVTSSMLGCQQPGYRRDKRGYKPEYDYYSLGVMLIEIGYWQPLKDLLEFGKIYDHEHDRKLLHRLSLLQQLMGRNYSEAVKACITGDFSSLMTGRQRQGNREVYIDFGIQVLSRLNSHVVQWGQLYT